MISGVRPNTTQTLWIYVLSTIAIVILTAIYTTLGGIKAVIWTDFIQASIMFGSALVAVGLLYFSHPGGWDEIVRRTGGFHLHDFFTTGLDPAKHRLAKNRRHVRDRIHHLRRPFRRHLHHDGDAWDRPGHGATDADRARHSPEPALAHSFRAGRHPDRLHLSHRSASSSGFITRRIPIPLYRKRLTRPSAITFFTRCRSGCAACSSPASFATTMGSLSTALNALATSFTRDWYQPYINPAATEAQSLRSRSLGHGRLCHPHDRGRFRHFLLRDRLA